MRPLKLFFVVAMLLSFSCKQEKKEKVKTNTAVAEQAQVSIEKLSISDFKAKIGSGTVQLIDVRTPEEYTEEHLENAKNINLFDDDFITRINSELDKAQPVYIYCRSGTRSGKAAIKFSEQGFKVYDLKGGILGWKASNYPVKAN